MSKPTDERANEGRSKDRNESLDAGMRIRRKVLGDAHVDRAERNKTDFDRDFQAWITGTAWRDVWSRPGLTLRDRSLLTIALLAALGHEEELAMHVRATANTGATREEVREALLHCAVYAGVPAANSAMRIAKRTYDEMEARPDDHGDDHRHD